MYAKNSALWILSLLRCSTNNKASTVLSYFTDVVSHWGLPSHVHCGKISESINVVPFIIQKRGAGCSPAMFEKSVHNQHIEHLWKDVFKNVCPFFMICFTLWKTWELSIQQVKLLFGACTTVFKIL